MRLAWLSMRNSGQRSSVRLYQASQGPTPVPGSEPAWNRHRESPGGSTGHHDVNLLDRRELRDERVRRRRGAREAKIAALAMVVGRNERAERNANTLVEVAGKGLATPALVGERPGVLGTHEEQRVGVEGKMLAVPETGHRP